MGGGAGNEVETQEEEDAEEQGDFGSQVSLNSSIQESETHVGRETGNMDKFGVVTTRQTHRASQRTSRLGQVRSHNLERVEPEGWATR